MERRGTPSVYSYLRYQDEDPDRGMEGGAQAA